LIAQSLFSVPLIGRRNLLGRSDGATVVMVKVMVLSDSLVSATALAPSTVTVTVCVPGAAYQPPRYTSYPRLVPAAPVRVPESAGTPSTE
jgi:hypothetical protein